MLSAENRAAVRLYWDELMNKHNLEVAERTLAPDLVVHDPLVPTPVTGREAFVGMLTELFSVFPDVQYTAEEEFAETSKVAIRWTMRGTHKGAFIGIAPTGRQVSMSGVDMLYLADGNIRKLRIEANLLGLIRQLGAVPDLDLTSGTDAGIA